MECRPLCGECCISWTISSAIPGMPDGKPAGVACVQLDEQFRCKLFGMPERPKVCGEIKPSLDFCGESKAQARDLIHVLELETKPN